MENKQRISMVEDSVKIDPPKSYVKKSYVQSYEEYLDRYRRSIEHPAEFWGEIADELVWQKRLSKVMDGSMPDFQFFPGSAINVAENCVDRHAKNPLTRNKVALFFEAENGERKSVTYLQLYDEVQKFANVLQSFGLQKGDVVSVYMQNSIETFVVLLACFRIGVIYNTVFAGFSQMAHLGISSFATFSRV